MSAIERLLKAIPYVRRPFYQRDAARADLQAAKAALAASETALAATAAALAKTKADLAVAKLSAANREKRISGDVRGLFDPQHWFLLPDEDERQDRLIGDFRTYVAKSIPKHAASLEIGPSYNPILPKSSGYNVTVLDHADQPALVAKYRPEGVDVGRIEPVDHVWGGEPLAELLSHRKFGAIVAAHVIEHAPDLVQFLTDCSDALEREGSIYLLVPDKRYAFDFMQPLSDVARVLGDHRARRVRHSFECYYRLTACVRNGERVAWDQDGIERLSFAHGNPVNIITLAEQNLASKTYMDAHENYFTPMSFAMIVDELRFLREIDLELTMLTRPRGSEFLAVLRKTDQANPPADRYLERKMQGYHVLLTEELERVHSAARLLAY